MRTPGAPRRSSRSRETRSYRTRRSTRSALADQSYNAHTLKALAAAGHGEYSQADAADLAKLFDQLGKQISNEYLLQYKSLLGPGKRVVVQVNVNGVGKTRPTGYKTPALPATTRPRPTTLRSGPASWTRRS